ncbi:MAG: hypothetical protein ACTHJ0_02710 [Flavipsychrobacter sp.]
MPLLKRKFIPFAYCCISIAAFTYVLIRSLTVSITFDEVWTIKDFVPLPVMYIINYTPPDANNHIINTLLIKLLFAFANHNVFIARLPNVLAFILYQYFGYRLCSKFLLPFIGLAAYLLLLLNPFLLDFFSLARGYGIALGMQMASFYYFAIYIKDLSPRFALLTLVFGSLSVLSNFPGLNYWLAMFFIILFLPLIIKHKVKYRLILINSLLTAGFLLLIIYEPIRKMKENGDLYYGGNNDFYHDTLISLIKYSFYSPAISHTAILSLNVFLAFCIVIIADSYYFNYSLYSLKTTLLVVLTISIASVITQHYLLHTLYLIDRTALFFYPLFILLLCLAINDFPSAPLSITLVALPVLAFSVNCFRHTNFFKTATWYFDAHTLSILRYINNQGKTKGRPVTVDFSWPFQSSFYYYAETNKYPFVKIIMNREDRAAIQDTANYYVYLNRSLEKVGYNTDEQKICNLKKDTVLIYPQEGVYLFTHLRH